MGGTHRLRIFEWALGLWAVGIVVRLFFLQVVDYSWLKLRAERQQSQTVDLSATRGVIYDRNLHPLAMSLQVDSIFAVPSKLQDLPATVHSLSAILGLDPKDLTRRLAGSRNFCWVARKVTASQDAAVRALHLSGIYFQPENERFYPKGNLAANVLGYVGVDGEGLGGIEREYDHDIRGQSGKALIEVDARHRVYDQFETRPQPGANLVLTVDQNIQYIVQQELDAQVAQTHAQRGMAIVENPYTGEILALADSPTFNPNEYNETSIRLLGNPAVTDVYEPGSVFKLVTMSAALQEHLTNPDEVINCGMGKIILDGHLIHDHARFGDLTVTQVLMHSSDVGAIKLGMRLGDDRFYQYIRKYGFGQRTGIELPGETAGLVRPPRRWTPISVGAVSIGQEVAVTPVQIIAMISSLADGGVYHAPHIVMGSYHQESDAGGPRFHPSPGRRIVSERVAAQMKTMMEQVMLGGTGQWAQLNGYSSAGKTGTAQKVDRGGHGYSAHDVVASFGGFAPAGHPAIAMLVVIDTPRGLHDGGVVAGPAWKRMADRILPYLGVPHDVPETPPAPSLAARRVVTPTPAEQAAAAAAASRDFATRADQLLGVKDSAVARSPVILSGQQLAAGAAPVLPEGQRSVVVVQYQSGVAIPDFSGQSLRAVSAQCQRLGLTPVLLGSGLARQQAPAAGTRVPAGSRVVVQFTLH